MTWYDGGKKPPAELAPDNELAGNGSLIVGDSVRGSLRGLTEERLGGIESSLTGPHFFGQSLAERLGDDVAPAILLNGTTVHPDSGRRATRVQFSLEGRRSP